MPIGNQEHGCVPVAVSVVLCGLDQLFNLCLREVFAAAKLAVWSAQRCNCSFFGGWCDQLQVRFGHNSQLPRLYTDRIISILRAVFCCKAGDKTVRAFFVKDGKVFQRRAKSAPPTRRRFLVGIGSASLAYVENLVIMRIETFKGDGDLK